MSAFEVLRLYDEELETDRQFRDAMDRNEPYETLCLLAAKATAAYWACTSAAFSQSPITPYSDTE